jgi:DNA invertase Pin-like site-specific DNA recombinase
MAGNLFLLPSRRWVAELSRLGRNMSIRTKQGLVAAKAQGKKLGRPKGSQNRKGRALDPFREQIIGYKQLGLPVASIMKIVNNQLDTKLSYNAFNQFLKLSTLIADKTH